MSKIGTKSSAILLIMLVAIASAQVTTGKISGTIKDSSGAVVPGAKVTLRSTETGFARSVTSDAQGRYTAPELPLGGYEVTAEAQGFQTAVRKGITLTVGSEAAVDFTVNVGSVTETVTIVEEAPVVE